jgi:tRNA (cmo5U34)-methyltransferase
MDVVREHFAHEAPDFDRLITSLVPGYGEMVDTLVRVLPFEASTGFRVLDLGCGTGAVAHAVLTAFPTAHVTCIDIAAPMIANARAKLAGFERVEYVVGDFQAVEFCGAYDAVVSSLALHHLNSDDEKRAVYTHIYNALNSGGVFFNADVVLGSSDVLQRVYLAQWRTFMRRSVSQEDIDGTWMPRYEAEDRPAPLVDQLTWLTTIGFCDVDVVWKYYNFAVYGGRRS